MPMQNAQQKDQINISEVLNSLTVMSYLLAASTEMNNINMVKLH